MNLVIRKLVLFLVISLLAFNIYAEDKPGSSTGEIKGILNDDLAKPVEYANIVLYKAKDSVMVTWTVSDVNGSFNFKKVPLGQYYISVNFMSFKKFTLGNIIITSNELTKDLGILKLEPEASAIGGVVISGQRKAVETKIDKKVVNVGTDITATGGTAVDLLKNVPGVAVDLDNVVSLRGNSNVSILVDGRPTSIDATRLDQIAASDVESIEVITNPSAKYNPEGMTGIINLKLKKKRAAGLNGMALATAGNGDKYTGSLSLNYNVGDFNIYGAYNGRSNEMWADRYLFRESYNADTSYLEQISNSTYSRRANMYKLGFDVNLNPRNSLSASWQTDGDHQTDNDITTSDYYDRYMTITNNCISDNSEIEDERSTDYALNYKKTFDKKGEELTIDYGFSQETNSQQQPQKYTYPDSVNQFINYIDTRYYNSDLQANWILPVGKESQLETGFNNIMRGSDDTFNQSVYVNSEPVNVPSQTNRFIYDEKIFAVYGTYTTTYKKLAAMAGIRFEETFTSANQVITNEINKKDYFKIYPTLHLSRKLSESKDVLLSYSRRIQRPDADWLNPFVDQSSPDVVRSGNPDLQPEFINSFESSYTSYWKNTSISATLFYKKINNVINRIVTLDSNNVSHMIPENQTSGQNYGLEFTFEQTIAKWWKLSGNGSLYQNIIKGDSTQNSNFTTTARIMSTWTPAKSFYIQLSGLYRGPQVSVQSESKPMYSFDIAVKKDMLNDKLSASVRVSDIFNTMKNTYTAWGDNFTSENWRKRESRVVYISLGYKFGVQPKSKNNKPTENGNENNGGMDF